AARATSLTALLGNVFALPESEVKPIGENAAGEEILRAASREIDLKLPDRPEEQIEARRLLARGCQRIALFDVAAEELGKALKSALALPGERGSVRRLDLASEWAMSMYLAGKGAEASAIARQALMDCRQSLGVGHLVTLEAMQAAALCIS